MSQFIMSNNNPKMLETSNLLTRKMLLACLELSFTCTTYFCFGFVRLSWISLVFLAVTPNKICRLKRKNHISQN